MRYFETPLLINKTYPYYRNTHAAEKRLALNFQAGSRTLIEESVSDHRLSEKSHQLHLPARFGNKVRL